MEFTAALLSGNIAFHRDKGDSEGRFLTRRLPAKKRVRFVSQSVIVPRHS